MKSIAIVLSVALLYPGLALAAGEPTDAAKVVDAFHEALSKGDREAVLASLDEKVQIFEQGWVERSRAEYAASHLASDLKFAQVTAAMRTSRTVEVFDNLACVTSEGRTTGTFEGKPVDSITLETMVLRRAESGWRIVHIHWSSRKPKS